MSKHSETSPLAADSAAVLSILQKLGVDTPLTLGNAKTGESYPLSPEVAAAVRTALVRLAIAKDEVAVSPPSEFTPNEAAEFLNVSRTYVMKLIENGTLPSRMVGSHHRIPEADLSAYKREQRAKSRAAMRELTEISEELGLYDLEGMPDKKLFRGEGSR